MASVLLQILARDSDVVVAFCPYDYSYSDNEAFAPSIEIGT